MHPEKKSSQNPVDTLSFDNNFLAMTYAEGMIFKSKRTGILHKFKMDVDPGYKIFEKVRRGVQWYMMEDEVFISTLSLILKNEIGNIVTFNGPSIVFQSSIKEN